MHKVLFVIFLIGTTSSVRIFLPKDIEQFEMCKEFGDTAHILTLSTSTELELPYTLDNKNHYIKIVKSDMVANQSKIWLECISSGSKCFLIESVINTIRESRRLRLLLVNPFENNRIIESFEVLQYLRLENAFTIYITLLILIVSITLLVTIIFCHKFEYKAFQIVEKRFAFTNIFSWEYLINKLKRIRVQNSVMKSRRSRKRSEDDTSKYRDSVKNSEQNEMRSKLEEELITLKTNEKILISAYFSKLRNHFKIEEDNISTTSSNIIHYTSKKRKSKRKKKRSTIKPLSSNQLQTLVETEESKVSDSHADNEHNEKENDDKIFVNEVSYTVKDKQDSNSLHDNSLISVSTSEMESTDSNSSIVVCPITAISFKNMIIVQINNSANYISIFYPSNRIMNIPDIIFFSAFKLLLLFYISALISPCDLEYSDTYRISKEYLFSFESIKVYLASIIISFPLTSLIYWMLKRRIVDTAYTEQWINKTERDFWLLHIFAYVIIICIGIVGLVNTTWISVYNLQNRISNTFYYDFTAILLFEVSIRQALLIVIPAVIYLKIFEDSTITIFKKALILISWFL